MSMFHYKSNITKFPTYLDGYFDVYEVSDTNDVYPTQKIKKKLDKIPFEELSISDRNLIEANREGIKFTQKIRVEQLKDIDSLNFLEIDGVLHKVFNVYHFRNKEGFLQSDITLIKGDKGVTKIDE